MFKCFMSSVVCLVLSASLMAGQPDLVARDQAYTQGKIRYTVKNTTGSDATWTRDEVLYFARDGRFRHQLGPVSGTDDQISNITFVQGRDFRYIERRALKETVITFDNKGNWPLNDHPWFFVVSKPNFPLALGLSSVKWQTKQERAMQGTLSDKTTVKVELGTNHLPTSLKRIYNGKVLNSWEYSGSLDAGNGLNIPKQAEYEAASATGHKNIVFDMVEAEIGKEPTRKELETNWFREGVTIRDYRVEPTIVWTYRELLSANGNRKTITPAGLLELSKKKAKRFETITGQGKDSTRTAGISIILVAVLGCLAGGYTLLIKKR